MDFNLSEEQIAFRDVVRRWVNEEIPKDLLGKAVQIWLENDKLHLAQLD